MHAFLARMIAASHLDPAHLCGDGRKRPVLPFLVEELQQVIEDEPTKAHVLDGTLGELLGLEGGTRCEGLRVVGPGVLAGPAQWALKREPGDGERVTVEYIGRYTHLFATTDGEQRPFTAEYRATYLVEPRDSDWIVTGIPRAYYRSGSLRTDIDVPPGYYQTAPGLVSDLDARAALQRAVDRWFNASGARTVLRSQEEDEEPFVLEAHEAPLRGDGTVTRLSGEPAAKPWVVTERGRKAYYPRRAGVTYEVVPFTPGQADAQTFLFDAGRRDDYFIYNGGLLGDAFSWPNLLREAVTVVPAPCDALPKPKEPVPSLPAPEEPQQCLAVSLPTALPHDPDDAYARQAGRLTGAALTLHVGLDETGDLARAHSRVTHTSWDGTSKSTTEDAWFSLSDTAPPPVSVPDPASTTNASWIYLDD